MRIDILTTFVEMFAGPFDESIIKRARESGVVDLRVHNLRDWTHDRHHKTDDEQYGGGDGMVMLAAPLIEAVEDLQRQAATVTHIILTTPQGRIYNQSVAEELSRKSHLILICGHYKGVDQRVIEYLKPDEISIGDYILTGGELASMVIVDSVVRLLPGAVNSMGSVEEDSFTSGLLDCPRYTRPREWRGMKVPEVLLSGNHAEIGKWRFNQAVERTRERRPELYRLYESTFPLRKEGKGAR
ncbi:MAG TPA: tRNA (guanosine(37)-N1)-methyltransferase TrmD [bacterium]|nr:tRNA (guanosine(37)-N1)-methyltransferase TrmD [Candidatus Omnitrophota bacterium]HOJ59241.1 tRNA (guanosine(37)-N1)-methyltransferase TrmD [bacterium]HOL93790.1 tRNA (guanosine(37)-N1)-methyltransferase TrmD [bacterium]HPP00871.1 tRNA (guanosine(37)-N1)-methyltransferase TrmD [bacterium]